MSLARDAVVIGVTGAFGSGCTTAGLALQRHQGFHVVRLSRFVREELMRNKPEVTEPFRLQLQAEGDRMREPTDRVCSQPERSRISTRQRTFTPGL